jgi:SAM-dependent methyltransferase
MKKIGSRGWCDLPILISAAEDSFMNWSYIRPAPWLDTRARFVAGTPRGGTLLDLGSSDGETLCHIAELRPDLQFFSADKLGQPENYPQGCRFVRADFERDKFPWPDKSIDAITCMHLVEHLQSLNLLMEEIARLLAPGGRVYFETPHPKTLTLPRGKSRTVPMNFFDDATHVRVVPTEVLGEAAKKTGLEIVRSGISRNWLFAAAYPGFFFLPSSRKKLTAHVHWLGWSAYLIARRPV